jgi:hypothetical protein
MDGMIQIEIVKGPSKGKVFRVKGSGFSIGRSPEPGEIDCALMEDMSVSRRHALGRVEGGRFILEDWPDHPSKAGLMAGGKRVDKVSLAEGEPVTVGRSTLVFKLAVDNKKSSFTLPPVWRRWLFVTAMLMLTALGTAAWSSRREPGGGQGAVNELDTAWSARCSGDLEDAVRVLRNAKQDGKKNAGADALEQECKRVARLFEAPRRLEESLRLDDARDAWQQVALNMRPEDPLRTWVETGCVARLTRQLQELRP